MKPRLVLAFLAAALTIAAADANPPKQESVVYNFCSKTDCTDGDTPQSALIADTNGNLYGTAYGGGDFGKGAVFLIDPSGVETVIYSFGGAPHDGAVPMAALTMDDGGNLYGTTQQGGKRDQGTVFELKPNGGIWQETVLHSFCAQSNCADGAAPRAPVTVGKDGAVYGTTMLGGSGTAQTNNGVVFRLHPPGAHGAKWREAVLYDFCSQPSCADGEMPYSPRLLLKDSTLYGTAWQSDQGGTLYSLSASGGGFQVLHAFSTTGDEGWRPITGVVSDRQGVLYGTTEAGSGTAACGTVYSYDPSSLTYQTLYRFCSVPHDAETPWGGVTLTQNLNGIALYGTTISGGRHTYGTIYRLTSPATPGDPWNERVLYSFCDKRACTDGASPVAEPTRLGNAWYGTASRGAHNAGVVYRYGP